MALTKRQAESALNLFVNTFITAQKPELRRNSFILFEDSFSKDIADWRKKCVDRFYELNVEPEIIGYFKDLCLRKEDPQKIKCMIRTLQQDDFPVIRDILNLIFDLRMSKEEEIQLQRFAESGLSFVALYEDEIVGVILAYEVPSLSWNTVYIDSLAVIEGMRGKGIGKQLFGRMKNSLEKRKLHMLKLQTSKSIEAYQIYKHWGFHESELVQMSTYIV